VVSFLQVSPLKLRTHILTLLARAVQIIELLIVRSLPVSRFLVPLRPKFFLNNTYYYGFQCIFPVAYVRKITLQITLRETDYTVLSCTNTRGIYSSVSHICNNGPIGRRKRTVETTRVSAHCRADTRISGRQQQCARLLQQLYTYDSKTALMDIFL
jgi:hypothetical protein